MAKADVQVADDADDQNAERERQRNPGGPGASGLSQRRARSGTEEDEEADGSFDGERHFEEVPPPAEPRFPEEVSRVTAGTVAHGLFDAGPEFRGGEAEVRERDFAERETISGPNDQADFEEGQCECRQAPANAGREFGDTGRSKARWQTSASPAVAGKNPTQENFASIMRPAAPPNQRACLRVGSSSQIIPVRNERPRSAVIAMSVVASPACARTVGTRVKSSSATMATAAPK